MGRRDNKEFKWEEVIAHDIPSKRELRMPSDEYRLFGTLYSHYRLRRRTWIKYNISGPQGVEKPVLSDFFEETERIVEKIHSTDFPSDFYPLDEAMMRLAPALLDDSDDWQRLKDEMREIRELFESEGPTVCLFSNDDPERMSFLSDLHMVRKRIPIDSFFEGNLLSVLFLFAQSVGARKNWKQPFNQWQHGVRVAQDFEFDPCRWSHRNCLIEARHQMIDLRRDLSNDPKKRLNRTQIKNRASIIYTVAHLNGENPSLSELIKQIRECRREHKWEAYLNKLPKRGFPKKPCA